MSNSAIFNQSNYTSTSESVTQAQLTSATNQCVKTIQLTQVGLANGVAQLDGSGNLTASGLKATNFVQPYAPISLVDTSNSIEFFGDSITYGATLSAPTTTRWSYLVCNALGKTELNYGVGGTLWMDASVQIYNNHTWGKPVFLAYGTNDMDTRSESYIPEFLNSAETFALFCCLPESCLRNPRMSTGLNATTLTGTWQPTPAWNNWGGGTSTVGDYITATASNRFVAIGFTALNALNAANHPVAQIIINGVTQPLVDLFTFISVGSQNGTSTWTNFCCIYDLQKLGISYASSYTIKVTYISNVGTVTAVPPFFYVDWLAGFDYNQANTRAVFLNAVPVQMMNINTNAMRNALNAGYHTLARKMRSLYGLPIYYVADVGETFNPRTCYTFESLGYLHPNALGHSYMADRVINVINNGETNYLNS